MAPCWSAKQGPSLQLVPPLLSHVKENIMDLGWFPAKSSRPLSAFLTLHAVSCLAGLMSLHSSNGPTPACEGLFCSLVHDLPSSWNQSLKKTQNKVFATLSFQGLCFTLTFRAHKLILTSNFRENPQKTSFCRTANISALASRALSTSNSCS